MSSREILVRIRADVAGFRSSMQQASAAARETGTAAQAAATQSQGAFRGLITSARENEQAWSTAGTSLLGFGAAAVGGVGLAIAKFAEFDKAMSEVRASTHETSANMDLLREAAIGAGADTAFSAKEAAQGIDELAKAGVSTKDILGGGLTGALSLAAAGSLGVGDAAELAATALTQFKLSGEDIPHVADLLAAGAGKAQGSVADMGAALKQAGLVASAAGLSIEETTGGLAAFASAGLVGSDAGTSFKSMLQRLTPQSKEAQKQMDELGISAFDAQGEFIGLAAYSGQLQNSMKDLDSESRNAAMGVMFGSDAVRAANVLYEQGATGVQGWIDAVDDAGFAAITASIKQDNLAGDIEKLGGSFDTVLIRGGEGAAQSLRGLVQSAEGLVDGLGKVKPELLQLGVGFTGVLGGVALLGGGFLTMLPKVLQARAAFQTLQRTNGPLASGLGKVGKAAGVAGAALAVLAVAGAVFTQKDVKSAEDYGNALLKVGAAGKNASASDLDEIFQGFDKFAGLELTDINNASDAIARLTQNTWADGFQKNVGPIADLIMAPKAEIRQLEERLKGLGDELGNLATNGSVDAAATTFNLLTDEFKKNGQGAQEALDKMPGYKDALLGLADSVGVGLSDQELLNFAMGEVPAKMLAAQAATDEMAASTEEAAQVTQGLTEGLEEIGVSAQGAITNLDAFTQSLVAAGLLTLSSRDAARGYKETLDSFAETVAKNGATLDTNTKAGRENEAALDGIAKSGIAAAEAMAAQTDANGNNVNSQQQVQANLKGTFNDLVNSASQLGLNASQADALARKLLGIPPKVNIDSWMADTARQKAQETKNAIDAIPKNTTVRVNYENTTTNRVNTINSTSHIAEGPGGRGGMTRATGGAVFGPGTGTSDDIPAWLSNGEHVWTAKEVEDIGGQEAMYRLRAAARAGDLPAFAKGGAVAGFAKGGTPGHLGESKNARANRLYREKLAREKARAAELRKSAQYRSEQASELYLDSARGDGYRTVTGGLSSAYSYSAKLRSVANSGNLPSQKWGLLGMANNSDASMRRLYAQSTKLTKSLETAKKRLDDLNQVKSGVSSNLSGEFNLADAVSDSSMQNGVANIGGIQWDASAKLSAIRSFGTKLNKLALKGYSGAIVQEIAAMGSGPGSVAADALLAAKATDVKKLNTTYTDITKASDAAGSYVTNAMYKGGVNAAAGLVKGLQSQEAAIEKQMLKIGLGMEKALKKALGIKSPSRVARAIGSNFGGSLSLGMADESDGVAAQAKALADAMYIAPSKSLAGGYGAGMSQSAYSGSGSNAPAAVVNVTAVVENPWTGEQVQAVVKSVATTAANGAIKSADQQSAYRRAGGR